MKREQFVRRRGEPGGGHWVTLEDTDKQMDQEIGPMDAMLAIADYCVAHGFKPANQWPNCLEAKVDDDWRFACNGHNEPKFCTLLTDGPKIEPFCVYVEWRGIPAASFDAFSGEFLAGLDVNIKTFIEALKK